MKQSAVFRAFPDAPCSWPFGTLCFADPKEILTAHSPGRVAALLEHIEQATREGCWIAVMLAYEAAPAFDRAMTVHAPGDFPLLWAAVYEHPVPGLSETGGEYAVSAWAPLVSREQYRRNIETVRSLIRNGETYQVNYTMPYRADFTGDATAWFNDAAGRQRAGFSACLDMGRYTALSFSPELFFIRRGSTITARPMKGTMPRGRWLAEDEKHRLDLARCPKNRAENVMIVDLVRNDLGRICEPGTITASPLFEVEVYPTVLQMTSTVEGRLKPGAGLADVFRSLFPCGSVTGAPKIRTMQIIRDLETGPRKAYCGAIGLVLPGGDCAFNVPIRTVILDRRTGRAEFSVGGGITHDSAAEDEYRECATKMRFLDEGPGDFSLIETMLWEDGRIFLQDGHLRRLKRSAKYFGFRLDREKLVEKLEHACPAPGAGKHKIRLLLRRDGETSIEASPLDDGAGEPLRVALADGAVNSSDVFLYHKTTRREVYDRARDSHPGANDVILVNERGQVTESCIANVVVEMNGRLYTPARECGLLDGVFRRHLLDRGIVEERNISVSEFIESPKKWLVSSVRKWREIESVRT